MRFEQNSRDYAYRMTTETYTTVVRVHYFSKGMYAWHAYYY